MFIKVNFKNYLNPLHIENPLVVGEVRISARHCVITKDFKNGSYFCYVRVGKCRKRRDTALDYKFYCYPKFNKAVGTKIWVLLALNIMIACFSCDR